jgi:hypothetical protein
MSGGHFDYDQYKIRYIADRVEQLIRDNGREKNQEELRDESWRSPDWYDKYPEDKFHTNYPDDVIEKFKEGWELLRKAEIFAQRIDWLVSGDDGENSFRSRLEEDLKNLDEEKKSWKNEP